MRLAWIPFGVVCAIAVARAVLAPPPEPRKAPLGEAQRREAFRFVASDEAAERREGAKTFPTDLWSRDDHFHSLETKRATDWAHTHHADLPDVLDALDEGLRAHWPHGNPSPLASTTPPCRPRAIY